MNSADQKKVLIVDDDESIVDAISLILEDEGYQVEKTLNGEETYEKIESFHPDVLLLDVLISGSDGRDICMRIKKSKKTEKLPIIMISAHQSADKSIKRCGAEAFLAKPFDTSDLLTVVSKYAGIQ